MPWFSAKQCLESFPGVFLTGEPNTNKKNSHWASVYDASSSSHRPTFEEKNKDVSWTKSSNLSKQFLTKLNTWLKFFSQNHKCGIRNIHECEDKRQAKDKGAMLQACIPRCVDKQIYVIVGLLYLFFWGTTDENIFLTNYLTVAFENIFRGQKFPAKQSSTQLFLGKFQFKKKATTTATTTKDINTTGSSQAVWFSFHNPLQKKKKWKKKERQKKTKKEKKLINQQLTISQIRVPLEKHFFGFFFLIRFLECGDRSWNTFFLAKHIF